MQTVKRTDDHGHNVVLSFGHMKIRVLHIGENTAKEM